MQVVASLIKDVCVNTADRIWISDGFTFHRSIEKTSHRENHCYLLRFIILCVIYVYSPSLYDQDKHRIKTVSCFNCETCAIIV